MSGRGAILAAFAAAMLIASAGGCSNDDQAELGARDPHVAMQDYLGYVDQLGVVLARIRDEEAARAAADEVADLAAALERVKATLDAASPRARDRLEYRYEDQLRNGRLRVNHEAVRLMSNKSTALALREAMAPLAKAIR